MHMRVVLGLQAIQQVAVLYLRQFELVKTNENAVD